MRGWCPRCDAVREAEGACPECQAPLVDLDDRPPAPAAVAERREAASEVAGEVEQPARNRLRVALAVAAVVLVALAFVAGRSTGGTAAPAAGPTGTTTTTAPPVAELQRQLGWRSRTVGGVGVEAVSISRGPVDARNGDTTGSDNTGLLTLQVDGLQAGRRLLAVSGLRMVDSGGGVFAEPDTVRFEGVEAVPVQFTPRADRYVIDLGPTPAVDTLDSIELGGLLLSATASDRSRVELPTAGAWPARPPTRAVEPTVGAVSVPISRADGGSDRLPLRVAGAFVGAGRVVVVLSLPQGQGERDFGALPVTADLRVGGRLICSRLNALQPQGTQVSPMLVIDCPARPAPSLTVDLGAGIQAVQLGGKLAH